MSDIAAERHKRNAWSRTNKSLTSDADKIGLAGEIAFATRILGLDHYRPTASGPTNGYQFTYGPWKIKVYTSTKPGHLFVKEGKVTADVYVLVGIRGDIKPENVYWCGWASSRDVKQAEVTTPNMKGNYVLPSHTLNRGDLSPLGGLCQIIGARGIEARGLIAGYIEHKPDTTTATTTDDKPETQSDLFDIPAERLQS